MQFYNTLKTYLQVNFNIADKVTPCPLKPPSKTAICYQELTLDFEVTHVDFGLK